ncbi:BMP family protein [Paradesulfitobacterium ferrireducens]|uniref:BMP family protein n=1 Tax=Paradesulfitobacterium ferrireducens TaxID=2816476 RepID=UPI001A8ECFAA|nr:BMP family protein [Paradesulfitobacterium ferrireducens]
MKRAKKWFSMVALLLIVALLAVGCGSSSTGGTSQDTGVKKLKVALLLPGPINDNGWDAVAYKGLKQAETELGVETAYRENVSASDMETAFRSFAQQKYDVIIGHGFQFGDAAKAVAKDFPNTKFVITSSNISQAPNLASMNVLSHQVGYLGGVYAALATKTKKIAFIGGQEIPPILDGAKGFAEGAKSVDPSVEVMSANTGSFDDVAKAKETAKAFIAKGADVVLGDANQAGLGVIDAAKGAGVYAIGYGDDQSNVAPETVIASGLQIYPVAITVMVKTIQDGKFEPKFYPMGIKEGAVGIALNKGLLSKLPAGIEEKINQVVDDFKSGKLTVGIPQ